jgi:DNA recombination-dependent growth factor C
VKCKAVIAPDGTIQFAVVDGAGRAEAADALATLMESLGSNAVPLNAKGDIEFHRDNPDHLHVDGHIHAH